LILLGDILGFLSDRIVSRKTGPDKKGFACGEWSPAGQYL
jgi:hypothetical protein